MGLQEDVLETQCVTGIKYGVPGFGLDPPIIVELKLSGKSDARQTVKLLEDSDLIEEPAVIWKPDSVVVSGLSTRREISVELKRKN